MPSLVLKYVLLCTLTGWVACACMLKNHTLWIERTDCAQCVAVNTTICSGYCYTQDTNFKGRFGRTFLIQRSCVPPSLVYRATHVPGCPQLYYPVAHRCSCRRCDMRTHHCIRTRRISYERCTSALGSMNNQTPALEI